VPPRGGAVLGRAEDGDLELARQEGELGVQRAPLAQDLGVGPRVDVLVGRDAGQRVGGDVADAVAAGLDAVHVDLGQLVHHVRGFGERDPVELQVVARGEMAVAAALPRRAGVAQVVLAGDARQHAKLARGDFAIGDRDAQHGRVALDVPAVLHAQRAQFVVAQLAVAVPAQLVAELRGAGAYELAIEVGVAIHRRPWVGSVRL